MDLSIIHDSLRDKRYNIIYKETVSSTNVSLKEMALRGEREFSVLIADSQTCGIGRKGNSFFSPEKTGVYMSILLKPSLKVDHALLITPLSAVCCARAIEKVFSQKAEIKWVNDIYVNDKKVCGILAQSCFGENGAIDSCILGIGVNVYPPHSSFPENIKDKAGYLCEEYSKKNLREKLIAEILNEFSKLYNNIEQKSFYDEYCSRSMLNEKNITVKYPNCSIDATVVGIDKDFRLLARLSNGDIISLDSGEVSVQLIK